MTAENWIEIVSIGVVILVAMAGALVTRFLDSKKRQEQIIDTQFFRDKDKAELEMSSIKELGIKCADAQAAYRYMQPLMPPPYIDYGELGIKSPRKPIFVDAVENWIQRRDKLKNECDQAEKKFNEAISLSKYINENFKQQLRKLAFQTPADLKKFLENL